MKKTVPIFNGVLKAELRNCKQVFTDILRLKSGECGGPSDGGAGAINKAGGAFKKRGDAKEAQYFHKKERELLENLKRSMDDQLEFHEKQVSLHQKSIDKIKNKKRDMDT